MVQGLFGIDEGAGPSQPYFFLETLDAHSVDGNVLVFTTHVSFFDLFELLSEREHGRLIDDHVSASVAICTKLIDAHGSSKHGESKSIGGRLDGTTAST